jgi:topoisomerase-4 subunit A
LDLGELLIKGRNSAGNRVTKEIVQKIVQKEVGGSTLAARKIWYDSIVGRLNDESRGKFLGSFKGNDKILSLYKNGDYRLSTFDLSTHFDEDMVHVEKWVQDRAVSTVYFDGAKELHFVKRFLCEVTADKRISFISEGQGSYMDVVSTAYRPEIRIVYNKLLKETKNLADTVLNLADTIEVKGMKAQGNQLTKMKVKEVVLTHSIDEGKEPWPLDEEVQVLEDNEDIEAENSEGIDGESTSTNESSKESSIPAKDAESSPTIEWDLTKNLDDDDQMKLF